MYFKKLELIGFKSFPSKTVLHFESGITAIVGPNGCGKSNVFDAIRWVLGEQSVKALRGSRMEDVIFTGTESKEPLGLAEVSLTFSNEDKIFPVEDKEFVVTRRIFRSGESEYLFNRNQVRLKDITELLMGTGIGAESYSLIEQGKIDLVLSSRPEDRRLVFDEASGVTKFKAQKKEALRKLEETEANLLRINDIINEVRRQINSLERQANKARRYKEVFEMLTKKETDLAAFQINKILKQKESLKKQKDEWDQRLEITQSEYEKTLSRQATKNQELEELENKVYEIREDVLNFDSLVERNKQHIRLNQERIQELKKQKETLNIQMGQIEQKLNLDKERITNFNKEYQSLNALIQEKGSGLKDKGYELQEIFNLIKGSKDKINQAQKDIFILIDSKTKVKNEIIELSAKLQGCLARQRRLEVEKSKVSGEKEDIQEVQSKVNEELNEIRSLFEDKNAHLLEVKQKIDKTEEDLESLRSEIQDLEKERIGLISQREFMEKLNLRYQEISEAMNAVVLLDKKPKSDISGIVIKVKGRMSVDKADQAVLNKANFKLTGEAKPIDLNTDELLRSIAGITKIIELKKEAVLDREKEIDELSSRLKELGADLHRHEIALANKQSQCNNITEQFNKINEELEIVQLELSQAATELESLKQKESELAGMLSDLESKHEYQDKVITGEQEKISMLNSKKEENLIMTVQIKTELESLNERLIRDNDTLNMLNSALKADQDMLLETKNQITSFEERAEALNSEIDMLKVEIQNALANKDRMLKAQTDTNDNLKRMKHDLVRDDEHLENQRQDIQGIKDKINKLQLQIQEYDFKNVSLKDRIMQSYKVDLDSLVNPREEIDEQALATEITSLKERLNSYGTVNLVAIEEYDELKKRYDFLTMQQGDLVSAKDSLHQAISKINRTAKKMFQECFNKISEEFRNFFRLLFGGGDANLFLIDENDPLESGIEIICRPPGKKLQNVSMLSGGEKSLSAISLIFAIFKVKPSPFCALDEVDAALDEANVDRYIRLLQEFTKNSQFIVITHNKRTIANANVMYGITMEEQGISKIVSVKFSQDKPAPQASERELISA